MSIFIPPAITDFTFLREVVACGGAVAADEVERLELVDVEGAGVPGSFVKWRLEKMVSTTSELTQQLWLLQGFN